jgi:hypothetical protein
MRVSKFLAGAAFLGLASSASAATFVVSDVEFPNLVNIDLIGTLPDGGPSYHYEQGAGPIFLTGRVDGTGPVQTVFVYCDDIPHHIYGGGGQDIVFNIGAITQNNEFDNPATNPPLDPQAVANISGLARLGYQAYKNGDNLDAGVIQAAIWIDEYGTGLAASRYDSYLNPYTAPYPTEDDYLNHRLAYYLRLNFDPTKTPALAQLLNTNSQGQIDVQGQIPIGLSVPEPAAWTTMLIGFFGMGGMVRRRRAHGAV